MKKILQFILFWFLAVPLLAAQTTKQVTLNSTTSQTYTLNSNVWDMRGTGANLYKFSYYKVGTVSAGACKLQGAATSSMASASDIIGATTVTSTGGPTALSSSVVYNYVAIYCSTALSGSGSVTFALTWYVDRTANVSGTGVANQIAIWSSTTALTNGGAGTTTTLLHGNAAGAPAYSAVVEADLSLSNNTTANVSTTKHGFAPILPNDATKFLDGTGAYSTPTGGMSACSGMASTYVLYGTSASACGADSGLIRDITDATNRYGLKVADVTGGMTANANIWSGPTSFTDVESQVANTVNVFSAKDGKVLPISIFNETTSASGNVGGLGIWPVSSGIENINQLQGIIVDAYHKSSGTLTYNQGLYFYFENQGGTVVNSTLALLDAQVTSMAHPITNAIGLDIGTQTGDTLSLAIRTAAGRIEFDDLKTTGAATGKKVVCVDTSTGILYASSTGIDCSN